MWSSSKKLTPTQRLAMISAIIEAVDNRCMAVDGPVSKTLAEMTEDEIQQIYRWAKSGDLEAGYRKRWEEEEDDFVYEACGKVVVKGRGNKPWLNAVHCILPKGHKGTC